MMTKNEKQENNFQGDIVDILTTSFDETMIPMINAFKEVVSTNVTYHRSDVEAISENAQALKNALEMVIDSTVNKLEERIFQEERLKNVRENSSKKIIKADKNNQGVGNE